MKLKDKSSTFALGFGINTVTNTPAMQALKLDSSSAAKTDTKNTSATTDASKKPDGVDITVHIPAAQLNQAAKPADVKDAAADNKGPADQNKDSSPSNVAQPSSDKSSTADTSQAPKKSEGAVILPDPDRTIRSNTYFIDSLTDLRKQFDVGFNLGATIPSTPNISSQIELNLSNITQNTSQELYYVLELYCIEKEDILKEPYELLDSLKKAFADETKPLKDIFDQYGDSFVNSISYGRWALVIIQLSLLSIEHKREISTKLGVQAAEIAKGDVTLSSKLARKLENEQYTIHIYTGGLDYSPAGILNNDIKVIDTLVKSFSVDGQKVSAAQIGREFISYKDLISAEDGATALARAQKLHKLTEAARELGHAVVRCQKLANLYWQGLSFDKIDESIMNEIRKAAEDDKDIEEIGYLVQPVNLYKLYDELQQIKDDLHELSTDIANHCLKKKAIITASDQLTKIVETLQKIKCPMVDACIPVLRISHQSIQRVDHKNGQYQFDISPPPYADSFQVKIMHTYDAGHVKLKLKQYVEKQTTPSFGPIPLSWKPKRLNNEAITKGNSETLQRKLTDTSKPIAIVGQLSRLYLKPHKRSSKEAKYFVDFYTHYYVDLPVSKQLPNVKKIAEIKASLEQEHSSKITVYKISDKTNSLQLLNFDVETNESWARGIILSMLIPHLENQTFNDVCNRLSIESVESMQQLLRDYDGTAAYFKKQAQNKDKDKDEKKEMKKKKSKSEEKKEIELEMPEESKSKAKDKNSHEVFQNAVKQFAKTCTELLDETKDGNMKDKILNDYDSASQNKDKEKILSSQSTNPPTLLKICAASHYLQRQIITYRLDESVDEPQLVRTFGSEYKTNGTIRLLLTGYNHCQFLMIAKTLPKRLSKLMNFFGQDNIRVLTASLTGVLKPKLAPETKKALPQIDPKNMLLDAFLMWGKSDLKDKKDLEEQLKKEAGEFGFTCKNVTGDGNCFFYAVADQLGTKDNDADSLRNKAVQYILNNLTVYQDFIAGNLNDFILKVSAGGEWADNLVIHALSRALNMTFAIIRSDGANPTIIKQPKSTKTIYLGYEVERHYQSLNKDSKLPATKDINQFIQKAEIDNVNQEIEKPSLYLHMN